MSEDIGDVHIEIDADGDKFVRSLTGPTARKLSAAAARAGRQAQEALERQFSPVEAHVVANAVTAQARAQLQMISRDRVAEIVLRVNQASVAKVTGILTMLSGWRFVEQKFDIFSQLTQNLDKMIPAVTGVSMAISALSSLLVTGGANVISLIGSIGTIVPLILGLPAVLGAAGVGMLVFVAAMQDAQYHLGSLKEDWSMLQNEMSINFWDQAAEPIREMVRSLFPQLIDMLGVVSSSMGSLVGSMADTLAGSGDGINLFLERMNAAIIAMTPGVNSLLTALGTLALAGSKFLEPMAESFTNMMDRFAEWTARISSDGTLDGWLTRGAQAAQDLWSVIVSLVEIFAGVARAAEEAGSTTLGTLAPALESISDTVNSPAFQGALVSFFEGMREAAAALAPGIKALVDAFVELAPTLGPLMVQINSLASEILSGLAAAISNPVFVKGLQTFFDGVESGLSKILPFMPQLGEAFGHLLSGAGQLADVFGGVLAAAFTQFEPLLPAIIDAFTALAPVLGGVLTTAINTLGPIIMSLVSTVSGWIQQNPELATTVLAVVAVLGTFAAGAVKVMMAISPLLAVFDIKMITALTKVGGALAKVGGWFLKLPGTILRFAGTIGSLVAKFAMMMGPVGWAITAIAALAAGAIWAYNNFEPFRRVVDAVAGAIMGALKAALDWLVMAWGTVSTAVSTAMSTVWATIQNVWTTISTTITTAMTTIWTTITQTWTTITTAISVAMTTIWTMVTTAWTTITTAVVTAVSGLWTSITTALAPITEGLALFWQGIQDMFTLALELLKFGWDLAWNALLTVVTTVWTAITTSIQTAIDFVSSIISTVLTAISTAWSSIWDAISSTVSTVWEAIKGYVNAGLTFISGIVSSVLGVIRGVFSTVWNAISGTLSTVWGTIKSVVSTGINYVRDTVSNILGQVRDKFREIWDSIKTKVSDVMTSIRSTVSERMEAIRSKVSASMDRTKQIFKDAWDRIKTSVSEAIGNVLDKVREIPGKITSALGDMGSLLYQAGRDVIQGLINGIGSMAGNVGSAMSGIASKIGGFLPGSPVKEGPLRSWNNGAAGKRLVNLLTDGIDGGEGAASAAMKRLSSKLNSSLMPVEMSVRRSLGSSSMSLTPPTPSRPASSGAGAATATASSGMMRMHPDDIALLAQAVISGAEKMSNRAVREYDMIKARSMR